MSLYLLRRFLTALVGTVTAIMGLVFLLDVIELLRRAAGQAEANMPLLLGMALLKLPQMVHEILPFAVLIATMVALWRLTRSSELAVMRSVGMSVWQFLAPGLLLMLLVGVVQVTLVNPLSATFYARFQAIEDRVLRDREGGFDLSESGGLWLRETTADGGTVIVHARAVRQVDLELHMRGMSFLHFAPPDGTAGEAAAEGLAFTRRVDADRGVLRDGTFHLRDAWLMAPGRSSRNVDALTVPTTLTIGRVQENFATPETVSFWELPGFIAFFEDAGFSARQHRLHYNALLASPLLLVAMALIAAVFAVSPNQRSGGAVFRVLGGVAAGFVFYVFSRLTYALGVSATLPLWMAAWSPALVALLLGTALLLHLEDG